MPRRSIDREYAFKFCYLIIFQIFLRARAREIQDGIPFLVLAPLLSRITLMPPHQTVNLDLTPINMFVKIINNTIGQIPLPNLIEKSR